MSTPAATNIYDSIGGGSLAAVVDDDQRAIARNPRTRRASWDEHGQTEGTAGRLFAAALGGLDQYWVRPCGRHIGVQVIFNWQQATPSSAASSS